MWKVFEEVSRRLRNRARRREFVKGSWDLGCLFGPRVVDGAIHGETFQHHTRKDRSIHVDKQTVKVTPVRVATLEWETVEPFTGVVLEYLIRVDTADGKRVHFTCSFGGGVDEKARDRFMDDLAPWMHEAGSKRL